MQGHELWESLEYRHLSLHSAERLDNRSFINAMISQALINTGTMCLDSDRMLHTVWQEEYDRGKTPLVTNSELIPNMGAKASTKDLVDYVPQMIRRCFSHLAQGILFCCVCNVLLPVKDYVKD